MRRPGWVLRARDTDAAAAEVTEAITARSDALDDMTEWVADNFGDGWEPGVFKRVDASVYLTGLLGSGEPPAGFRRDRKRYVVPKKSTPLGAGYLAKMSALDFDMPLIQGLGGIVSTRNPDTGETFFAGFRFVVIHAGPVFACLSEPPDEGRKGATALTYDQDRWEYVRLSTFHLAVEAAEDRHGAESIEQSP